MVTVESTIDAVTHALIWIGDNLQGRRDSEWTQAIHGRLGLAGEKQGFLVQRTRKQTRASGCDCDHVWHNGSRIVLGLEIEWGFGTTDLNSYLNEAFERLLRCDNAELRVMVMPVNGNAPFPPPALIRQLHNFGCKTGDRFLFCGWRNRTKSWVSNRLSCE